MTKKVRRHEEAPIAWEGSSYDLAAHRGHGWRVVLLGHELVLSTASQKGDAIRTDFASLSHWFDLSRPTLGGEIGWLVCGYCRSRVGRLTKIWQDGRESVVEVAYQQRTFEGRGDEMVDLVALVHAASEGCEHGPLLMHDDDVAVVHCRSHDLTLTGRQVVEAALSTGGWESREEPPRPRRVVLR